MTQPEPVGGIADLMSGMPEVWRRLLAVHVPDRLGRCACCRTASGSGERWPCSLHQIAREAQRLYGLRLGQAVAGD
ncbi:MAG TPA: hypothetical protein VKZ81_27065 [Pseudonocardia sp.]|uniref:hypothetical protein n=1 Tax=Pseudonocardia sp. TaxID=60912 RepID=UPI002B4B6D1D|nr:hypothetical protein [Pseudonocardia sp.]HLU59139.1 hypothetical protein [Pseudonocardia sp.]